jgi:hypothetical protein
MANDFSLSDEKSPLLQAVLELGECAVKTGEQFELLSAELRRYEREAVDALTTEQRQKYYELRATGVCVFDALKQISDLAH